MPATKRKRGAQPGNLNALKHGFYSRRFRELELEDLDAALADGLANEIALLRVAMRRLFELADEDNARDLDNVIRVTNTIALTAAKLSGLMRTQHMLGGDQETETAAAISQAIREVLKEKKLL